MMKIKFRIWNMTGNCMHEWPELVEKNKIHLLANQQGTYPVMQFTGLTDVSGVEIYEGDICVWYINNLERLGEVYYHDQSFEMRSPSLGYIGWDANRGEVKVIGNIYQNLELLK